MVAGILLFGLIFQGILAFAVYNDAYQRGDDEGLWVVVTLLFGVLGVLLYLLSRPDERLPADEQEQSASTVAIRHFGKYVGRYIASILIGIFVVTIISFIFIQATAPEPTAADRCNNVVVVETGGEPADGDCAISQERLEKHQARITPTINFSPLIGSVIGVIGLFIYRNK